MNRRPAGIKVPFPDQQSFDSKEEIGRQKCADELFGNFIDEVFRVVACHVKGPYKDAAKKDSYIANRGVRPCEALKLAIKLKRS